MKMMNALVAPLSSSSCFAEAGTAKLLEMGIVARWVRVDGCRDCYWAGSRCRASVEARENITSLETLSVMVF
jgi:hypothetical protein